MTTTPHSSLGAHLRSSWRVLAKEIAAFGVIGAAAFVIDFGMFTWLAPHGALKANCISTGVSTAFAYIGNRNWSFSHRARSSIGRETTFFFGINLLALVFSELAIALFVYGFGYGHDSSAVLVVKLVTIGIGTLFRFWAYKRFVFLHPDRVHAPDADLDVELAE